MRGRIHLLALPFLLLCACGSGAEEPAPLLLPPPPTAEGTWVAMVEVVDASSGAPLSGAVLEAQRMADLEAGEAAETVAAGVTDSSGRATLHNLPAEALLFRAQAEGYRPNAAAAQPLPPQDEESLDLTEVSIQLTPDRA